MAKNHYAAYLTVALPDGTKKQLKFYGSTQKEANAKRDEAKVLNDRGLLTFNSKTPLRRYAEEYHKTYIEPNYGAKNAAQIWQRFETVFLSELGNMPVSSIKKTHLVKCLNKTEGKSQSYYDTVYRSMRGLFRAALEDGIIIKNPTDGMKKDKRTKGERRALTQIERQTIFPILQTNPRYAFFAVMLGCGLRPGEVTALTWSCVDFKEKTVTVTQSKKVDGEIGSPKSRAGLRTVPAPDFVLDMIAKQPKTGAFIFTKHYAPLWKCFLREVHEVRGGKVDCKGNILVCGDGIGDDLMPYYLRHTFCTMMAENNVPIKTAQKYMGHSSVDMTMQIYSHASEEMDRQAKEKMANMFAV